MSVNLIPTMTPIASSFVEAVGYEPARQELHIRLRMGHYIYQGVPPDMHRGMMASESIGRFYGSLIKGKFPCERLQAAAE